MKKINTEKVILTREQLTRKTAAGEQAAGNRNRKTAGNSREGREQGTMGNSRKQQQEGRKEGRKAA